VATKTGAVAARNTTANTALPITEDRLLADRGLYSRALASYTASSIGVGDLLDLLLYAMVLPDLVGYYAIISGYTIRTVVLSVLLCQLSLGLAKTYGTLFLIFSLKLSGLAMSLEKSSSDGLLRRTAQRLMDKLSLMTARVNLRKLMEKDNFKRIVKNIDSLERLRKDNRRMSTTTSVLLGFLHSLCRYLGLGKLANKVKTILRDRRLTRGLIAQGPVRRESIGNMRRSRGLLGLVNRIRANRIIKAAGLGEGKGGGKYGKAGGGGRDGKAAGARELARDRRGGRAEDRENTHSVLDRSRKLDSLLAGQDYPELIKRARALAFQRENGENLSLKDRLAQEIATRQLAHDFSSQLMRDVNILGKFFNFLGGVLVNAAEIATGRDINRDGRIGGVPLAQLERYGHQHSRHGHRDHHSHHLFGRRHGHHSHEGRGESSQPLPAAPAPAEGIQRDVGAVSAGPDGGGAEEWKVRESRTEVREYHTPNPATAAIADSWFDPKEEGVSGGSEKVSEKKPSSPEQPSRSTPAATPPNSTLTSGGHKLDTLRGSTNVSQGNTTPPPANVNRRNSQNPGRGR
jgi:hypothetical protein